MMSWTVAIMHQRSQASWIIVTVQSSLFNYLHHTGSQRMLRVGLQSNVVNLCYQLMPLKKLCYSQTIFIVPLRSVTKRNICLKFQLVHVNEVNVNFLLLKAKIILQMDFLLSIPFHFTYLYILFACSLFRNTTFIQSAARRWEADIKSVTDR